MRRRTVSLIVFAGILLPACLVLVSQHVSTNAASDFTWSIYQDQYYGFAVMHPDDWRATVPLINSQTDPGVIKRRAFFAGPSGTGINIDVFPNLDKRDLQEWFDTYQARYVLPNGTIQTGLVIAGEPAIYSLAIGEGAYPPRHTVILLHNDYAYRIEYQAAGGNQSLDTYRRMLESFAFYGGVEKPDLLFDSVELQHQEPAGIQDQDCCGYHDPNYNPYPCSSGNCTWWARYKRPDTGGQSSPYWGSANNWTRRAEEEGFAVNGTPSTGALGATPRSGYVRSGWENHVAYVESFNGSTVNFSDMDYGEFNCSVDRWSQSDWSGIEFIHTRGSSCPAPSLIEPADGAVLSSRTITFRWNAVSGCTFNGYTFRVCTSSDVENLGNCFIDTGEGGTQRTETINGHDNQDLWWGVKAANAPGGASWAVRRVRIQPGTNPTPTPTQPPAGTWRVDYYNGKDFGSHASTDYESSSFIAHDWGTGSPGHGVGADNFSIRYERHVSFGESGEWQFTVRSDDGFRLYVDDQLLAQEWWDGWHDIGPSKDLAAGDHRVKLEYFEGSGDAKVALSWMRKAPTPTVTPTPSAVNVELVSVSSHVVKPNTQFDPSITVRVTSGSLDPSRGDHLYNIDGRTYGAHPVQAVKAFVGTGGTYTFDVNNDSSFRMTSPANNGQYQSKWQVKVGGNLIGPQIPINITVDGVAPTGRVLSPSAGAYLNSNSVNIVAEASDNVGVDQVQFFVWYNSDWHYCSNDANGADGYQGTCNLTDVADQSGIGLDALILDRAWNRWDATVGGITLDRGPPSGRITSPGKDSIVRSCPVTINAEANDSLSGIDRVEFHVAYDGSWHHLGDDSTSPYSWTWNCSSVRNQRVWLTIHVLDKARNEVMDPGGYVTVTLAKSVLFREDFSGSIASQWMILNQDSGFYSLGPDRLRLRANSGDLWQSRNDYKNLFLVDNPTNGDFDVTMRVFVFLPADDRFPQIDIVAYDDDDNHIRSIYGSFTHTRKLEFGAEINQVWRSSQEPRDFGDAPFYLRLRKVGNAYVQYHSTDGVVFSQANSPVTYGDGTPSKLGFVAMVDPSESSVAEIDWFEITAVRRLYLSLVSSCVE